MVRKFCIVLSAALLLSGCGAVDGPLSGAKFIDSLPMDTEMLETENLTNMKIVAENKQFSLLLDPGTGDFAVRNKSSGGVIHSNPLLSEPGLLFSEEIEKSKARAALIVDYLNEVHELKQFNSYSDSAKLEQIEIHRLEQGVRLIYTLGQDPNRSSVLEAMTVDFFVELAERLNQTDRKTLKSGYMLLESEKLLSGELSYIDADYYLSRFTALRSRNLYILRDLTPTAKERLGKVMKKAGLTAEETEEQKRVTGTISGDSTTNIVIPLDLTLSEDGLRAEIDLSLVSASKGITVLNVSVLPGFYAMRDEGNYIVPDGSGALVPIRQPENQIYAQRIYGEDKSKTDSIEDVYLSKAVLPFFGVAPEEKDAMLAVIEEGAAAAKIFAEPSQGGGLSKAYAQFAVTDSEYVSDYENDETKSKLITAPGMQTGKFRIFFILMDEPAEYSELAVALREFLQRTGRLPKAASSSLKLYLDLYGYTQKPSGFMGINANKDQIFTSYSDAQEILQQLYEQGVKEVSVRYLGAVNGGLQNTNSYRVRFPSILGGGKGFKQLQQKASELGYSIYLDLVLNYVYRKTMFDRYSVSKDTLRAIDGTVAYDALSNRALNTSGKNLIRFPLTMQKTGSNLDSVLPDLKKMNLKTVSFSTIGNELQSDFSRKHHTSRTETERRMGELLGRISEEKIHFLVDTGNLYALPYADGILNLPAGSSGLNLESQSIPFVPIVLSGAVEYALAPLNKTGDTKVQRLRAIECGAQVYYGMMAADNLALRDTQFEHLYSLSAEHWLSEAVESYRYIEEALSTVRNAKIREHRALSEEVFETRWDNGVSVFVNYGEKDFESVNFVVPAGGYAVKGGETS